MIFTYFFLIAEDEAQKTAIENNCKTFTIVGEGVTEKDAQELADKRALELAGRNPVLRLGRIGNPEIRVILHRGEVHAVYARNVVVDPMITVEDTDIEDSPDTRLGELQLEMNCEGFRQIPYVAFAEEDKGS